MEKRTPHYDLAAIQTMVGELGAAASPRRRWMEAARSAWLRGSAIVIQFKEK